MKVQGKYYGNIYGVHFVKLLVFSFEYLELAVLGVSVLPSHS